MEHSLLFCQLNITLRLLSFLKFYASELAQSKIQLNWLETRAILDVRTHYSDGNSFLVYRLHKKINTILILIELLFSHL